MFQPGTYHDGVLGSVTQPGSYHDGSLGILAQPGAYRDGTLGAMPWRTSPVRYGARDAAQRGSQYARAAARTAALQARWAAQVRSGTAFRGLGFALSDVPTWGWIAGGLAVAAAGVYLLKK